MLNIKDFEAKYELYTDEELYNIYKNIDNYSEEASMALDIVLTKKGGIEPLIKRLETKAVIEQEKKRISKEAALLGRNGVDVSFIKKTTNSSILSLEELHDVIETNVEKAEAEVEDAKVNSDTIMKSLLGCGLASLVGGAFVAPQFMYFRATSILMIAGLALICYGIVKFVTKKSYNNTAVLLSSLMAFLFSYMIGYFIYFIFGYVG